MSVDIPYIKGKELDNLALRLGLRRQRILFLFKESDKNLRKRCEQRISLMCNGNLYVLGCKLVEV